MSSSWWRSTAIVIAAGTSAIDSSCRIGPAANSPHGTITTITRNSASTSHSS
jgi:hypothetical protein